MASVQSTARRYGDYAGRASQTEYWYWFAFSILVSIVVGFVAVSIGLYILATICQVILLVPGIALLARRLNDAGRPANWAFALLGLVVVSWLLPYIGLYALAGPISLVV